LEERLKFNEMVAQVRAMIEKVGVIGVNLQMAGLQGSNGDKNLRITQEDVFDMIAQIKALKMSVVFNTKMGTLY
jgi:hypothetical protein